MNLTYKCDGAGNRQQDWNRTIAADHAGSAIMKAGVRIGHRDVETAPLLSASKNTMQS